MVLASVISRAAAAVAFLIMALPSGSSSYQQSVERWRQSYEAILRDDNGWLTVSGLFWMHEGENSFGSAPENDVVLPAPVPAHAGHFEPKLFSPSCIQKSPET